MKRRVLSGILLLAILASLACGCAAGTAPAADDAAQGEGEVVDLGGLLDEAVPLAGAPAISTVLAPVASTISL